MQAHTAEQALHIKKVKSNNLQRPVKVACAQFACSWNIDQNVAIADQIVRDAVNHGAQIVLLQELFETPYFPQEQRGDYFALAGPASVLHNPLLQHFSTLARDLSVVLPISFFERAQNAHFNSIVVFDADGSALGIYRKSHIPDGPGYQVCFPLCPIFASFAAGTSFCSSPVFFPLHFYLSPCHF